MSFDEELRAYLAGVERGSPTPPAVVHRRIEEHDLHAHLLARLRAAPPAKSRWVAETHAGLGAHLGRLAAYVASLPPQLAPVEDDHARAFACDVLDWLMDCVDDATPQVDRLELRRVGVGFTSSLKPLEAYAQATRLTRRDSAARIAVTGLGIAFLRLWGKDAVRWLLTLEVTLSRGKNDPWCASKQLLDELQSEHGINREQSPDGDEPLFSYDHATLARLSVLGVATAWARDSDGAVYRYTVDANMRDVVHAAAERGPWHAAVEALLEDERSLVVRAPGPTPTESTIDQTRMIAHEVRNALVPVRHHIDAMLAGSDELAAQRPRVESARRGVVRVLEFVDQMVAASELITEPAMTSSVADIVREAIAWVDATDRVEIELEGGARVRAPRSRLARAVANLVLNAIQASAPEKTVRVVTAVSAGFAVISVDDAGSGIDPESRSRVFDDGFTTRPGGLGFGLAFVRRVVETELRGKVWCEQSELGGARFVISLPEADPDR